MLDSTRVILIGGSSHAGKSTLAEAVAGRLGWAWRSTDKLARHPGRPWNHQGEVKPHVAAHYAELSPEELIEDVLAHYRQNVLPQVAELIHVHATDDAAGPLVLEGSALWPAEVAELDLEGVKALWLTASDELLTARIHAESRYAEATPTGKYLTDKFLARTLLYNRQMVAACAQLDLPVCDVEAYPDTHQLTEHCLSLLT
jgi:2-phosphoglycerate kinase